AMKQNGSGRLTSIDTSDNVPICGKYMPIGWIVPDELKQNWVVHRGASQDILPALTDDVDGFMHDSLHSEENMLFEFGWATAKLKKGGILMSDDIDLNQAWNEFFKKNKVFNPMIRTVTTGVSIRTDL
ncbi:hypothetical protein B1B_18964, partial [mine drainage metagenome]